MTRSRKRTRHCSACGCRTGSRCAAAAFGQARRAPAARAAHAARRVRPASPAVSWKLRGEGEPGRPVLLFGQTSEHSYSLDFGAPLSPFAAFGIALSAHVSW